jgi:glycogen synthase
MLFFKDNNELCNNIERSKIILNIHNYKYNYVFNYYRNAFLLANKAFIIYDTNFSNEHNLIDIKNNLITIDYNNIINTIDYYINNQNLIGLKFFQWKLILIIFLILFIIRKKYIKSFF